MHEQSKLTAANGSKAAILTPILCTSGLRVALPNRLLPAAAGNLVVEGVSASSYIDMIGSEAAMHAAVGIGRWLWSTRLGNAVLRFQHSHRGYMEWAHLGLGSFLSKVRIIGDGLQACGHSR